MTKLQAAMKDQSAKKAKEGRGYFRCGSAFKACLNCGEYDEDRKVYTSGFEVFRSYHPKDRGWTYACFTCGAKDAACWSQAWDLGQEPRILPRSDISPYAGERGVKVYTQGQYRKEMRDLHFPKETVAKHSRLSERELKIMALEAQLKALQSVVEGGGR